MAAAAEVDAAAVGVAVAASVVDVAVAALDAAAVSPYIVNEALSFSHFIF